MANFVRLRLDRNDVGFDGNTLLGLTDLERRVGADGIANVERDASLFIRLKAGRLHTNLILSHRELGGVIAASAVGCGGTDNSGVHVDDRDFSAWDCGAALVGNRSHDAGGFLTIRHCAEQNKAEHQQQAHP